jgi:hypothetical protein
MNKRIYIAGKLNGMATDYIKNIHEMIRTADLIRRMGFSVYIPAIDVIAGIVLGDWKYEDYFNNSQPWLDASDALFLVPGWQTSSGTKREIERAERQNIPVFTDPKKLIKYFEEDDEL